jgi:hypothetical protein
MDRAVWRYGVDNGSHCHHPRVGGPPGFSDAISQCSAALIQPAGFLCNGHNLAIGLTSGSEGNL